MTSKTDWDRRGFLAAGAAVAMGTLATANGARAESRSTVSSAELEPVVAATADCQKIGEACLALSVRQLGQGDTRMSRCQQTCITMLAATRAMLTVATHATADSKLTATLADATAQACRECESACREFPAAEYKRCAESCRRTATICEALLQT